ncbi:MAG: imidazole glycerol phosphate synthase subunit HisH [Candidatus Bathyarchaeota archaeon]|uniref:imidazole glycerol phosphate synthase subunit HisH n=1 Tax=Candidatus Bathycorpusculum sp. TaxID=2994959 RepID=UPI0028292FFC|nr:imidazole glycerol phosphate synthase subunit HisH [Candidatus Termiticorpusculum sp.]MCL2256815.1 imidazole glycerol phosphate synthase subunit HisH [Candidatus Termiticorpusculum sp.]MCL2293106.1 imidazole glycerol phosphate synthase subunit HisH [Candidatus Termiticorpusculum sp.]
MQKAVIFDYGVGNLLSLKCAIERAGLDVFIGSSTQDLAQADAIVLPGVGSFTPVAKKLAGFKEIIQTKVTEGVPLLGICLGLQLFFEESAEGPGEGLALFKGKVVQLQGDLKIPHMGWNTFNSVKACELFNGINNEKAYVYFVHSFYPVPFDECVVCAKTTYGLPFTSAVVDKNMYGLQFHPEKSGDVGLQILQNFVKIVTR